MRPDLSFRGGCRSCRASTYLWRENKVTRTAGNASQPSPARTNIEQSPFAGFSLSLGRVLQVKKRPERKGNRPRTKDWQRKWSRGVRRLHCPLGIWVTQRARNQKHRVVRHGQYGFSWHVECLSSLSLFTPRKPVNTTLKIWIVVIARRNVGISCCSSPAAFPIRIDVKPV